MHLNDLAKQVHETAQKHGFYDNEYIEAEGADGAVLNPSIFPEKLALMHSELSEALEAWRDGDESHIDEELVDALIRILDTLHWRGVNIEGLVTYKDGKNQKRPYKHGRVN